MEPVVIGKTYVHSEQLFHNGSRPEVVKSHCCLCHRKIDDTPFTGMTAAAKARRRSLLGNCCVQCNHRSSLVGRYLIDEKESDLLLAMIAEEPAREVWMVDDVAYWKHPGGRMELYD